MSLPWFKNHLGLTLDEAAMKDIPNPPLELAVHVTIKDVQAFGLLGTLVVGPISALARANTRSLTGLRRRATRCGLWGMALGCVAGPAMTYARLRSVPPEGVYDRCYRLRHNRGQVRVDQASVLGLLGGGTLGVVAGGCPMFGALFGMSSGVIAAAVYNNKMAPPSKNKETEKEKHKETEKEKDKETEKKH